MSTVWALMGQEVLEGQTAAKHWLCLCAVCVGPGISEGVSGCVWSGFSFEMQADVRGELSHTHPARLWEMGS